MQTLESTRSCGSFDIATSPGRKLLSRHLQEQYEAMLEKDAHAVVSAKRSSNGDGGQRHQTITRQAGVGIVGTYIIGMGWGCGPGWTSIIGKDQGDVLWGAEMLSS